MIESWYHTYSSKKKLESVLELAAGPARHAIEFSRAGKKVAALDCCRSMCTYARRLARENNVKLRVLEMDMISFDINDRFDLVLNLIDSISHIKRLSEMIKHLKVVARHLADGGIYVIELSKLDNDKSNTQSEWNIKQGKLDLHVKWQAVPRARKGKANLVKIDINSRVGRVKKHFSDSMYLRAWTKEEIDDAINRSACFDVRAIFGAFESGVSWKSKKAWRLIYILRKQKT